MLNGFITFNEKFFTVYLLKINVLNVVNRSQYCQKYKYRRRVISFMCTLKKLGCKFYVYQLTK